MVLLCFSRKDFLFLGLELADFTGDTIRYKENKMILGRFKDSFYPSPWTADFFPLTSKMKTLRRAEFPSPIQFILLLTLFYLKKYLTKRALATFLDSTEQTVLAWTKRYGGRPDHMAHTCKRDRVRG
jgi:hypothetical protein